MRLAARTLDLNGRVVLISAFCAIAEMCHAFVPIGVASCLPSQAVDSHGGMARLGGWGVILLAAFLTELRRIGASDGVNLFCENELCRFEVAPLSTAL